MISMTDDKSKYSILAVDDSDIIISLIQILLEVEGYTFYSASSADEAMDLIQQHDLDLVLLDIEMPDVTGVELLQKLNDLDLLKTTKVVMLTGKTDVEHVNQSLELGAKSYILKPFEHDHLKDRIWEVLQES